MDENWDVTIKKDNNLYVRRETKEKEEKGGEGRGGNQEIHHVGCIIISCIFRTLYHCHVYGSFFSHSSNRDPVRHP